MLTKLDFTSAIQKPYVALTAGVYEGQTDKWEGPVANSAGDGENVVGHFKVKYDDPDTGESKTRTLRKYWSLKPQALWSIKRDLIAMGADPEDLSGDSVDLETILRERFPQVPNAVKITLGNPRSYQRQNRDTGEWETAESEQIDKIEAA